VCPLPDYFLFPVAVPGGLIAAVGGLALFEALTYCYVVPGFTF